MAELAASHAALVEEFLARGEPLIPWVFKVSGESFAEHVAKLRAYSRGEQVPQGFVPNTTFWLVDERRQILGAANLRHRLTRRLLHCGGHIGYGIRPSARGNGHATWLLEQMLRKAAGRGLRRVLLTCLAKNEASRRVIERCGGRFRNEVDTPEGPTRRYWIALPAAARR